MPKRHRSEDSDHISSIAAESGITLWQTVWLSEANADLRSKRSNPNLLFKGDRVARGDVVVVPNKVKKDESKKAGSPHKFKIPSKPLFLRLRILDAAFGAIADADYELTIDGLPDPIKGKTDANGQLEAQIPPQAEKGRLGIRVPPDAADASSSEPAAGDAGGAPPANKDLAGDLPISWDLQIGGLNPIREQAPDEQCISGVQARLNNLALDSGPVDGILGDNTKAAVKAFQQIYGLKETGEPDVNKTQSKLKAVHDDADSLVPPPPPSGSTGG